MGVQISYKEHMIDNKKFLCIFLYLSISENLPITCNLLK